MKKLMVVILAICFVAACGPVQKQAAVAPKAAKSPAVASPKVQETGKVTEAYFSAPPEEEEALPISYF